jgi:uncharacterized RDD family membrane protein YckC
MDQSAIGNRQPAITQGTTLQRANAAARVRTHVQVKKFRAPFSLRCGAILIDYIVVASIVAFSTLIARMFGGAVRTAGSSTESIGLVIAAIAAVLDFGVLAGLSGQTVGKWATGLRIERADGRNIGLGRAVLRHFIGYPLSFVILGLGFLVAAINARGRTLADLIADTVVVREEIVERPGRR